MGTQYAERRGRTLRAAWVMILVALGLAPLGGHLLGAQAGQLGQWTTLPYLMPINPVHMTLLNNGKVLIIAGSGNVAAETNFRAAVWDPQSGGITTQALAWDMFCNGMSILPDGRVFINGGNLQYDPFRGHKKNAVYDPATGVFTDVQSMNRGRWYPTVVTLGDGRVMTFSGLSDTGGTNTSVEIYTPGSGWSPESAAGWTPPLYPRMHLMTNGNVFYAGSGTGSRIFNTLTRTWSGVVATTNYTNSRGYGTSVMLPLTPENAYKPRVMIFGGGNPATATTEIIDLSATPLQWQYGPSMSQPRIEMNATLLPNGRVLATGGSINDENASTASYNADIYDPIANSFSSGGTNAYPRLYHSNSLLLPDATVLLAGGNPVRGSYEQHVEIYSPAYLFNGDGTLAARPAIDSVSSLSFAHGASFQVETSSAANIASIVLARPGAPTHAFDMEQRLVGLSFTAAAGVLNVTAPPNGNIAPPGYYMLFILNSAGVPSVARFVRITAAVPNQPPTATITSPAGNVTINPGESVSFAGSGTDADGTIGAYSWTFAGGNPGSSSVAAPGSVTYSTPGTHVASFTVTDNNGAVSAAVTRTTTVADFSLSATPSSQTAAPGAGTTYTATVTPSAGFTGTVGFSVSGLPAGTTGDFNPTSVNGSGSSTLTISTSASTPFGTYPLTITGTSGPRIRTTNVTLVVANQPPTATITSPAGNVTINPGDSVSFAGSGTDADGTIGAYSWTFAGGNPGSSSVAAPGSVTYMTPGTYAASFTVTDNNGAVSAAVTRTVTVADFSLSATPSSRTVAPGAGTTYTATVTPVAGFTGAVGFSVSGLPAGTTGDFNPTSVNGSGSSTLTISTSASTPFGTYPLTITGASGPRIRTTNVTLVVVNQPPTATITSPAGNVTINPGQSVSFAGSGTDPDGTISAYAWTFAGGNPGSSSVAAPGSVTYTTPGTYAAAFTVTDNNGAVSAPVTRTVTVADFSLSATPSSRTVAPGAGTTYTATVTPIAGFTGTVGFSVSGLPAGATGAFNPTSVNASGSSTLTISTSASTPLGTYQLTITGASGPRIRTTNVTLVVAGNPNFTISVVPSSRTISRGAVTTYNVTISAQNGFTGTVNLTVTGVPSRASSSFNPLSIAGSGTSVLTVDTDRNVQRRTYTLTITGTSGSLVHTANVNLVVQ